MGCPIKVNQTGTEPSHPKIMQKFLHSVGAYSKKYSPLIKPDPHNFAPDFMAEKMGMEVGDFVVKLEK